MIAFKHRLRSIGSSLVVAVMLVATPGLTYADAADTTAPNDASSQSQTTASNGTTAPTGSDAHTFCYNQSSGLWENQYYTWNPTTKAESPKYTQEYTYNDQTGTWDTHDWEYNAASGQYDWTAYSVKTPPAGAVTHGGPVAQSQSTSSTVTNGADTTKTSSSTDPSGGQINQYSNTSNNAGLTSSSNATISNTTDTTAQSGVAEATGNRTVGDATSGSATAQANVINLIQSAASIAGNNAATFNKDITGDVSGDILIDPSLLLQAAANAQNPANINVNVAQNGTINNAMNVSANSGNATLEDNTHAGNVTSGNANAVANVMNLINSTIAANQSFIGSINIYGNYTGNILVPQDTLNALIEGNQSGTSGETNATTSANTAVANNVDLAAQSGSATLDNNTHAGDATTGNAMTNLTILNLTGRNVVADDSMLVFVNVLGKWVGLIMNAPAGTTAAALSGGAQPMVDSQANVPSNTNIDATQTAAITNNINVGAQSGDALGKDNTTVGNVRSGNATASANIANVVGSQFSLAHWFGILFINVFGTWNGNFGAMVSQPKPASLPVGGESAALTEAAKQMSVFEFKPAPSATPSQAVAETTDGSATNSPASTGTGQVLGASTALRRSTSHAALANQQQKQPAYTVAALPLGIGVVGLGVVGAERLRAARRRIANTRN